MPTGFLWRLHCGRKGFPKLEPFSIRNQNAICSIACANAPLVGQLGGINSPPRFEMIGRIVIAIAVLASAAMLAGVILYHHRYQAAAIGADPTNASSSPRQAIMLVVKIKRKIPR
jgi:hypothetical protein